jgi:hypothetical protein
MVSFQFSLKESGIKGDEGIGGAIGISETADGGARFTVFGRRLNQVSNPGSVHQNGLAHG